MINRSSSSRRRKTPRTTTNTSPQRSANTCNTTLVRKQSTVAFENLPDDEKDDDGGCRSRDDRRRDQSSASSSNKTRTSIAGNTSTNAEYTPCGTRGSSSGGGGGVITVTATDEFNTTNMFPAYSPSPDNKAASDLIENAGISLNEYPLQQKNRSSISYDNVRSPRSSITAAADESYGGGGFRGLQNTGDSVARKSRSSLVPDVLKSPRSSLVPEDAYINNRSARGSIDPSLFNRGSRSSLLPDPELYNRASRPSMVADVTALRNCGRNSLVPDLSPNRSPRNSLVPESSRGNLLVAEGNRSSRNSLVADNRSSRNSLLPDGNRTPRGSLVAENSGRAPRGSVTSEGSVYSYNRSSRSSLPLQDGAALGKSPRGSIASTTGVQFDLSTKTPRGSIESVPPGISRISGQNYRSISPFHSGSIRGNQSANNQITDNTNGSRRASSSVSQVSGDDRRQLCEHTKLNPEAGLRLTAYGSFIYQLNHANMESSNIVDFVVRALFIIYRTVVVTVLLVCLTMLPLIMLIMGSEFIRDCPKEPHIPVYMVVGGCFGLMKIMWVLWGQIRSLRYERLNPRDTTRAESDDMLATSIGTKIGCFALNAFLVVWFLFGNYWILHIYWPDHEPTLFKPDNWCHKTLYVFSVVHLIIIYSILAIVVLIVIVITMIQVCLLRCR